MCDPTGGVATLAVLSAVVGVGSAVSSYQGQMQAARAQTQAANQTYAFRDESIRAQAAQLDTAQTEDAVDREIESIRAQGRIANSISDMGLGDFTGTQLTNVNAFETGRAQTLTDVDFAQQRDQLNRDERGAILERDTNQGVKPSSLSLLLGIGQGVIQGANTWGAMGGRYPGKTATKAA